jgi:hypothetical protein
VTPWAAAALTGLAVLWSVPNYPAPVPSWYNLFFAVFGTAAVVRFLDTRRARWLVVAGLCGGLSFLVKLVGLYYVAGVLLFLLLHEQSEAWERAPERTPSSRGFSLLLSLGLVAFVAVLVSLILGQPTLGGLLIFVVPGAAIAAALLAREWRLPPGSAGQRTIALARLNAPFLVGVFVPIAVFALALAFAGGLGDFYHGLFVAPKQRLEFASFPTPAFSIRRCGPILLLAAVAMTRWRSTRFTRAGVSFVAALLTAMLVLSAYVPSMYLTSWRPVVFVLAIVAVAGAWRLRVPGALTGDQQVRALVIFVAATTALVQYPFPAPVYFCYVAPLVGLAAAAAASNGGRLSHPLASLLLIFYILFAAFRLAPGFIYRMGRSYEPVTLNSAISAPRANGIRMSAEEAQTYNRVLALVSEHSRGGTIYASPDAPEIYVLAETSYPGRTIYEFLADPPLTDVAVLEHLSRHNVSVVVIKKNPRFSDPLSTGLLAELRTRYPLGETVDMFEVRWTP